MRFSLIEDKFSINYDSRCPNCGKDICSCPDDYVEYDYD